MNASCPSSTRSLRSAFSLVELLVVIAIIGVLAGLLMPAISQARARAEEVKDISNIRQGSYNFLTYFNDFKNFMPPLAGTWGYNYGSWYAAVRPYVALGSNPSVGANYRQDNPFALLCESRVTGVQAPGFTRSLYATNWVLRYRVWGDPSTSWRLDELQNVSNYGLLMCNGWAADSIYWTSIPFYTAPQYANATGGQAYYTGQHKGQGSSTSFLDGRAQYVSFGKTMPNDIATSVIAADAWNPAIPWTHRSFWGKTISNVYLQTQYKYND